MTRVLVISDLHCGHRAALTPPAWWYAEDPEEPDRSKWARMQRETWAYYLEMLQAHAPYDVLIVNGDMVEGKGERSGSTELITASIEEQAHMAARCIESVHAPVILMTYGTPYHVGNAEDYENEVFKEVHADAIESEGKWKIEDKVFDVKHFVSASTVPYGRSTAINRDKVWASIWSELYGKERPSVTIRSHVHYYDLSDNTMFGTGLITPALEGPGTKHGGRKCMGWVDFGVLILDVEKGEQIQCTAERRLLSRQSQDPLDVMMLLKTKRIDRPVPAVAPRAQRRVAAGNGSVRGVVKSGSRSDSPR